VARRALRHARGVLQCAQRERDRPTHASDCKAWFARLLGSSRRWRTGGRWRVKYWPHVRWRAAFFSFSVLAFADIDAGWGAGAETIPASWPLLLTDVLQGILAFPSEVQSELVRALTEVATAGTHPGDDEQGDGASRRDALLYLLRAADARLDDVLSRPAFVATAQQPEVLAHLTAALEVRTGRVSTGRPQA
jgi:hypothetical protein